MPRRTRPPEAAPVCRSRSGANRNATEAAPQRAGRGRARAGDTNNTTTSAAARGGRGRARGAARGAAARRGGRAAAARAPARPASPPYRAARMSIPTAAFLARPTVRARVGGQPAVSSGFIHMLLQNVLQERNDEPANVFVLDSDDADSDSDIIDTSASPSDSEDEEGGPLQRDANHIRQPIFDEDQAMYQRELRLYHDDDEFQVPPAQVPTDKGQPIEPDGTWGDCTMCSNTPVKPQGCNKCLQILGCAHCIKRWHQARKQSADGPSCPLCRNPWTVRAKTSAMKTIEAKKKKLEAKEAAAASSAN